MRNVNLSVNIGTVVYEDSSRVARWTIGKLSIERSPQLSGSIELAAGAAAATPEELAPPVELQWKVKF